MSSCCLKPFHWNIKTLVSCHGFCNSQTQAQGHPTWSRCGSVYSSLRHFRLPFCCNNRLNCTGLRFPITAIVIEASYFYLKPPIDMARCNLQHILFPFSLWMYIHCVHHKNANIHGDKRVKSDRETVGKTKATFINMVVFWEAQDCLFGV